MELKGWLLYLLKEDPSHNWIKAIKKGRIRLKMNMAK